MRDSHLLESYRNGNDRPADSKFRSEVGGGGKGCGIKYDMQIKAGSFEKLKR